MEQHTIKSDILKVSPIQLRKELEAEGVTVLDIRKARTFTPISDKTGKELKPRFLPTEVDIKCAKKLTKKMQSKLQKVVDAHTPLQINKESKEDLVAQVNDLISRLQSLSE